MQSVAVIDCGTNTFHCIIAQVDAAKNTPVHYIKRHQQFVDLGRDGLHLISPAAQERIFQAFTEFHKLLAESNVHRVYAIATAAFRSAINANSIKDAVRKSTGIDILIIEGETEASWIAEGVQYAVGLTQYPYLIMDIGGGSVEFICIQSNEVAWSHSFPIGVARLFHQFHHTDPIHPDEVEKMQFYLHEQLQSLFEAMKKYKPLWLIGASGAFEVLQAFSQNTTPQNHATFLDSDIVSKVYDRLIKTHYSERRNMQELSEERKDMIIAALILLNTLYSKHTFQEILISPYALKEGVLLRHFRSVGI